MAGFAGGGAWLPLSDADLTGFVDGTANPVEEERKKVALVGKEDAAIGLAAATCMCNVMCTVWRNGANCRGAVTRAQKPFFNLMLIRN